MQLNHSPRLVCHLHLLLDQPLAQRQRTPLFSSALFFTTVLLASIVAESNNFAARKGVDLKLCVEELEAFIAINIAMGMLKLPQIRDY